MSTPGFQFFGELFSLIDGMTASFASTMSTNVATVITPIVGIVVTITMIIYLALVGSGAIDQPLIGTLKKLMLITLVAGIALTSGIYQSHYTMFINGIPDDFAQRIAGGGAATASSIVDMMASRGYDKAGQAFNMGGFLSLGGNGMQFWLLGVVIFLVTFLISTVGMMFLLVAKVGLAILGALGPLFICAVLMDWSRGMFTRWLSQIFNYWMIILILSLIFSFIVNLFDKLFLSMQLDGTQNSMYTAGVAASLGLASIAILFQAYRISSIVGGVSLERTTRMPRINRR